MVPRGDNGPRGCSGCAEKRRRHSETSEGWRDAASDPIPARLVLPSRKDDISGPMPVPRRQEKNDR